jgi:hypothetical protein
MLLRIICLALAISAASPSVAQECRILIDSAIYQKRIAIESVSDASMTVIVDADFWRQSDYAARRELFSRLNCAIAGQGKQLAKIRMISSATGRTVATQTMGELDILQ